METKISERDLAKGLSEVLARAHEGERFVVERNGIRLAVIAPPFEARPGILGCELAKRLGQLQMPGDGFADDIEAARANVLPVAIPPWHE